MVSSSDFEADVSSTKFNDSEVFSYDSISEL